MPIDYVYVVFTIDHALNALARCNATRIYDVLFGSAAQTLQAFVARFHGNLADTITFSQYALKK